MDELSTPGITALRHRQDNLVEHSLDRVSATYTWYRGLPQDARTQIASVARLGVEMFVDWVENRSAAASPTRIFSVAPATLTGVVTLDQTLGLVRTVLDVVLEEAPLLVPEDEHDTVRILVLTFGRDVGFAAAEVYARAAEARGAWGARLESVAVDAMLHDSSQDVATRAAAAGWRSAGPVVAVAGRAQLDALAVSRLRHQCRGMVSDSLISVRGDSVIIVLGGDAAGGAHDEETPGTRVDQAATRVAQELGGAAVVGPVAADVARAGGSLRSALSGLRALPGWTEAPSPVHADELLPERLLGGDPLATEQILARVYSPLHLMGDPFEETVATYLALGGSLEATARTLFVHANTVRYRLGRVSEQVGWDPTDSRDALMLHVAIIVARLVGADA
ncbi:PucR family transcriptional regulator [Actinomyces sp. oral taxon 897]|uniref:PucR family transcriptional regulator n=1 Tax=Actinomyces sp. oral taxon 897 TaxID=2081702 RepID=UPI000D024CF5|nr:helix-turn-helix domain-containing protein [Actinomyces sp. oral taxon 897]AVM61436.1 PucR family transcriptional regulator [Actinomyces sp. oral taxon 897]